MIALKDARLDFKDILLIFGKVDPPLFSGPSKSFNCLNERDLL